MKNIGAVGAPHRFCIPHSCHRIIVPLSVSLIKTVFRLKCNGLESSPIQYLLFELSLHILFKTNIINSTYYNRRRLQLSNPPEVVVNILKHSETVSLRGSHTVTKKQRAARRFLNGQYSGLRKSPEACLMLFY